MRSFLIGLGSGLCLSALRTPLGLDLLQLPAREPQWAMGYRAIAFLLVAIGLAIGLRRAPERFSPIAMLGGTGVGFTMQWVLGKSSSGYVEQIAFSVLLVLVIVAVQRRGPDARPSKWRFVGAAAIGMAAYLLMSMGTPSGHLEALLAAALAFVSIVGVGLLATPERVPATAVRDILEQRPPSPGGLAGLAVAGAGLTWLAEGVARHVRELGGGTMADDGLFGTVFLALALFGAVAFARLFKRAGSRGMARAVCLATSGVGAWAALRVLTSISTPRGLDRFVRRFGFDLSLQGMVQVDVVIAAAVFVVPAFLIGTALGLCRKPLELTAMLIGGAAGLVVTPTLLAYEVGAGADGTLQLLSSSHSAGLAMAGGAVAAAGGLFAVAAAGELRPRRRAIGAALSIAGGLFALLVPVRGIEIVGPWLTNPPEKEWLLDGPEGLFTLERAPTGGTYATLDRRALCPPPEASPPDLARFHLAWALLGEAQRETGAKVLLIGQLTLERALTLTDLGAARVDRTAAWYRVMPLFEERLLQGSPSWLPGEVLTPEVARAKITRGEYDLIIAPPVAGERASLHGLEAPQQTTVVAWFDAADGYSAAPFPPDLELLLHTPDLVELELAAIRGPGLDEAHDRDEPGAPDPIAAGRPGKELRPLAALLTRREERGRIRRAAFVRRVADAERTPGILGGLAVHFEAQTLSSPFDSWELTVELEEAAMVAISEAAAGPAPSALTVQAAQALAAILRGKRRIEEIERFLTLPAENHAPWPELELALAQADLEFLDPDSAVERLSRLLDSWRGTPPAWAMLAEAHQQVGGESDAVECLERAFELDPRSHLIEQRLAIALVRAGDPRGPAALEEALAEHPDDPGLLPYLGEGPYPAPPAGYHPLAEHHHAPH